MECVNSDIVFWGMECVNSDIVFWGIECVNTDIVFWGIECVNTDTVFWGMACVNTDIVFWAMECVNSDIVFWVMECVHTDIVFWGMECEQRYRVLGNCWVQHFARGSRHNCYIKGGGDCCDLFWCETFETLVNYAFSPHFNSDVCLTQRQVVYSTRVGITRA
jgi:hypothetical protein